MKHIKIIMMMVLLLLGGRVLADNLYVKYTVIKAGGQGQIAIELINPDRQYEAFQFDLVLPEGINIAKNDNDNPDVTLNTNRMEDHTLSIKLQEDNSIRFMSYSMDDKAFKGTDGALVFITLEANEGLLLGSKEAIIKNQVMSDIIGEVFKWEDTTFQIEIVNYTKGDVNGDEIINIADVVEVSNYIMGSPSDKFNLDAADTNDDGEVNAEDVVKIMDLIMNNK